MSVVNNPAKGIVKQEKAYRKRALELLREARLERNRKREQEIIIPVVEVQPTLALPTEIPSAAQPIVQPKVAHKKGNKQ